MADNPITRRCALGGAGAVLTTGWLGSGSNLAVADIPDLCAPDGGDSEFWSLARELAERCRDFARLEEIYDSSDAAWACYDDAYQGIVVTARCIHWSEQHGQREDEIRQWVSEILPDDIEWVLRPEPPIDALSEPFAELARAFENDLHTLAEWAAIPPKTVKIRHDKFRDIWNITDRSASTRQHVFATRASSPGDRMLKRRVIEFHNCGLAGSIAKARHVCGRADAPSRESVAITVEFSKSWGLKLLQHRPDWRDWQWLYA